MSEPLPRIRANLDFMPSPVADRPGLLIRDPFQYSDATLIIPPPLVPCLECFDGQSSTLDLRAALFRITGDLETAEVEEHLVDTLSRAGFLEDENYALLRDQQERRFAEADMRLPAHAGTAYPSSADDLRTTVGRYLSEDAGACGDAEPDLVGIAAPHISLQGGWETYQAAYRALHTAHQDRVFVVLGTSHYGEPDCFGLTRKPFLTPYGETRTEPSLVEELAAKGGDGVKMEDYCHAVEHSIEFQVVFLQHIFGPDVRVVPVLCGAFKQGMLDAPRPEAAAGVERFLGVLGEIAARESDRLLWVLGIDMAHMGRRYGDTFRATADRGEMASVAVRDANRLERVEAGDADGFWSLVRENHDDLKWCGAAPLYTFLRAHPGVRGALRRYQQWNIDDQSVVSFGALTFQR